MMSRTAIAVFGSALLMVLLLAGSQAQTKKPEMRLLETGAFHGDEVEARTGEQWLGLYVGEHGSLLLPYRLTVKSVADEVVDQDGEQTGKQVSVDLPLNPILLVTEGNSIHAGPVTTVFSTRKNLTSESPVTLRLRGQNYLLQVADGDGSTAKCGFGDLPRNARLVLTASNLAQTLYTLEDCGNDPSWYLIWAGDLDLDGKLDLYVSVTQHYNISQKKLFLSSAATGGELVSEVAEFVTGGC
jgi:hypothetical protein